MTNNDKTPSHTVDQQRRGLVKGAGASLAALAAGASTTTLAAGTSAPDDSPAQQATTRTDATTPATTADPQQSKLVLLGTAGGPTPKVRRAAPASAIVIGDAIYVVDCGNGVARQMVLAGLNLGHIRHTFITHNHSDHNADYGNLLLLAWATNLDTRVDTWRPAPLRRMTDLFMEMNAYDIQTRITSEGRPPLAPLIHAHEIADAGPVMDDNNVKVTAALVRHPPMHPAFAYRFDCPDRSIVFSGDTGPSDNLIELARGADVLVHEVIDLEAIAEVVENEAMATRLQAHLQESHTPMAKIGQLATEAGVDTLVLNHFVPGTAQLPDWVWYNAVKPHFKGRLVVGQDLMVL